MQGNCRFSAGRSPEAPPTSRSEWTARALRTPPCGCRNPSDRCPSNCPTSNWSPSHCFVDGANVSA